MRKNKVNLFIISGIFLGVFVKLFVFDFLHVRGSSMYPALKDGDVVFVNRLAYGLALPFTSSFIFQWSEPKKGDVVIFLHDDKIVVKRCVLTSNSHLEFSEDSEYNLMIEGKKVSLTREQFIRMKNYDEVPEGYILALGDNLDESIDSRAYGFVSVKNITGKIIGK